MTSARDDRKGGVATYRSRHDHLTQLGTAFYVSATPNGVADRTADDASHERRTCGIDCRRGRLRRDRLRLCRGLRSLDRRRRRPDGRKALCQQRFMLQFVEIAGLRIVPHGLPTLDRAARIFVEVAVRGPFEVAQRRQSPLNVATFALIEPELLFRLVCCEGSID